MECMSKSLVGGGGHSHRQTGAGCYITNRRQSGQGLRAVVCGGDEKTLSHSKKMSPNTPSALYDINPHKHASKSTANLHVCTRASTQCFEEDFKRVGRTYCQEEHTRGMQSAGHFVTEKTRSC